MLQHLFCSPSQHLTYPACMPLQDTVMKVEAKTKSLSHHLITTPTHYLWTSDQDSSFLSKKHERHTLNSFFFPISRKQKKARNLVFLLYSQEGLTTACCRVPVVGIFKPMTKLYTEMYALLNTICI